MVLVVNHHRHRNLFFDHTVNKMALFSEKDNSPPSLRNPVYGRSSSSIGYDWQPFIHSVTVPKVCNLATPTRDVFLQNGTTCCVSPRKCLFRFLKTMRPCVDHHDQVVFYNLDYSLGRFCKLQCIRLSLYAVLVQIFIKGVFLLDKD